MSMTKLMAGLPPSCLLMTYAMHRSPALHTGICSSDGRSTAGSSGQQQGVPVRAEHADADLPAAVHGGERVPGDPA